MARRRDMRNRTFPINPQPSYDQNRRRNQASFQRQQMQRPLPVRPSGPALSIGDQALAAGLSPEDTMYLNEWVEFPYEERLATLRQVAQHYGFDKGWPARNMQNIISIINQIPARAHVSMNSVEIYASHLPPMDQT